MPIIGAYPIVGTLVLDCQIESGGNQQFKRGFINIGGYGSLMFSEYFNDMKNKYKEMKNNKKKQNK